MRYWEYMRNGGMKPGELCLIGSGSGGKSVTRQDKVSPDTESHVTGDANGDVNGDMVTYGTVTFQRLNPYAGASKSSDTAREVAPNMDTNAPK